MAGSRSVVVIPFYKSELSPFELISLNRCCTVLSPSHDVVFVAPDGLDLKRQINIMSPTSIVRFDVSFFDSLRSYSKLLLSPLFYRSFSDYEYLLIYQLDCYVFRDEFLYWCDKKYSYIGSPWVSYDFLKSSSRLLKHIPFIELMLPKVGNGGFSLRHVKTHIKISEKYDWILSRYGYNEDLVWCGVIARLERSYTIPSLEEALPFSFEMNPADSYETCNRTLPFGCHAVEKYDVRFWADHIPELGERETQ